MENTETNTKEYKELESYLEGLIEPPKNFTRGQIIKGEVIKVSDKEMIINVGGRTEGVVSGRELKLDGEKLIKKPGEQVLVYVIKPENDKGQIELSIRRTGMERKWHDLEEAKANRTSIKVTVTEANTGGVIVNISEGVRGFVPSSQLDNKRIYPTGGFTSKEEATQQLQGKLAELIETELEVVVMEIDREKNRVILSEKQVGMEANREHIQKMLAKISVGTVLKGEVTGIAPFGLFVSAEGLEGLVHLSEISWNKVANPADFYQVGNEVDVEVIGIEDSGKRIAYSIKRLLSDPWDEIVQKYKVGQIIKGEITKVVDYGAFVHIDDGLNGLIHISELSNQLVKDPNDVVKEGETRDVMVISMSKEDRHLGLSIKRLDGGEPIKKPKSTGGAQLGELAPEMARLSELLAEEEQE